MTLSRIYILLCFCLLSFQTLKASIYCPPSKTLSCHDDFRNLSVTGRATTIGYSSFIVKYSDQSALNNCKFGNITRTWYLDINQDNIFQSSEPNCTQIITITGNSSPIIISFPKDTTYTCKATIANEKPTWIAGPCDVLGVNVTDTKFEINGDACYKIARKFTIMNWCAGSSGSNSTWTHTQMITVKEENPPRILDCTHKVFDLEADCLASVTLTNSATDDPQCKSPYLSWIAEVDLWANGTVDYKYGFTESGDYKIAPVADGEQISIKIPHKLSAGKHKVKWSVRDRCGNYSSCTTTFETKDRKPPTPYIQDFITSAFQASAMPLMVPARIFNSGSYDNCSLQKNLKYSFSEDINDTIRIVDCSNAGFQFFTVYIWDEAGNYEFVDVFMLVFDNGTCQGSRSLDGLVLEANQTPVKNAKITLSRADSTKIDTYSDQKGRFLWNKISIFNDYIISVHSDIVEDERVDIADLKMLQDHIFGTRILKSHEWLSADTDGSQSIGVNDLYVLKDLIISPDKVQNSRWKFMQHSNTSMTNENIFKSLKFSLDIKEVKGKLQFDAVYNGDISDAIEVKSKSRSSVEITSMIENNQEHYFVTKDMKISGAQIKIIIPDGVSNAHITSAYAEIKQQNFHFNAQTNEILLLNVSDIMLTSDKPLFTIAFTSESDVKSTSIKPGSKLLLDGYETRNIVHKLNNNMLQEISISPNPGQELFIIKSDISATITQICDITGKSFPYTQHGDTFHFRAEPGIYFVRVLSGDDYRTIKLLKL